MELNLCPNLFTAHKLSVLVRLSVFNFQCERKRARQLALCAVHMHMHMHDFTTEHKHLAIITIIMHGMHVITNLWKQFHNWCRNGCCEKQ